MVRIGIIGTGYTVGIAKTHINGYKQVENCRVTAIYDIVQGRAREWMDRFYPGETQITPFDDFDQFLEEIDGVSVCTCNSAHVEMMERCLAAGKHVISEKPLSTTLAEAERVRELEQKYPELVKMVVFNYREKPGIAVIKDLINQGKLGKIYTFRYMLGGLRIADTKNVKLEWRMQKTLSGTGSLADFGCHMLDLFDYLVSPDMGRLAQAGCFTETFVPLRYGIESGAPEDVTNDDAAVIIGKTTGGCLCSITACRLGIPREVIEISAEGGTVYHDLNSNTVMVRLKPLGGAYQEVEEKALEIGEEYRKYTGHGAVLGEFISCIQAGSKPARSLEHGLYIQQLLDALERSAGEGKMIKLPV